MCAANGTEAGSETYRKREKDNGKFLTCVESGHGAAMTTSECSAKDGHCAKKLHE